MLIFDITNETDVKVPKDFFQKYVDKLYRLLNVKIDNDLLGRDGTIDLVLTDDKTVQALNREYRGINKPTDVISFAYLEVTEYEKEKGDIIVGDIFISADTAKKQAKKKKHSLKKELAILFVHGLLHLFGFDHQSKKQEAEMEKWAKKLLS
ncbi:rRNA maturation RNase YbeY [Candidatus Peregrinibacteria bacterium]|nr:rRNA maturation RNase YbeY [Candidatus Peregrinibacteria bacterium]